MSDPAAADHLERPVPGGGDFRPLTAARIDHILGDFRGWLEGLANLPPAVPPAEPFNVQQLVAQFTALRHEVNMQTKAARSAVEQTNAALQLLQPAEGSEEEEDAEHLRPIVKMLLDVHDALSVAEKQMEKAKRSAGTFAEIEPPPLPTAERPNFLARLFGAKSAAVDPAPWLAYRDRIQERSQKLHQQFAAVADGYAMSLRRIERTFDDLGLEAIACQDAAFDPELMEVVDAVADPKRPPGTVIEVVRAGYLWNDTLFRYAQVKVAK